MYPQMKNNVQIFLVLLLAGAILVGLSALTGGQMELPVASAQEPVVTPAPIRLSDEAYEFFRQQVDGELQAAAVSYNVGISKVANPSEVVSGQPGSFKVSIVNNGGTSARYILFQDEIPFEMTQVSYTFSKGNPVKYTDGGVTTWMFDTIAAGDTIEVTVSGRFDTSFRFRTVLNIAKIMPLLAVGDSSQLKAAQASITVINPAGAGLTIYLPFVRRDPTPTPTPTPPVTLAYHETFNDEDDAWDEFGSSGDDWYTENRDDQYWVRVENDKLALPPAKNESRPERPYRRYGEFEVTGYHSEGESNASLGIFFNGAGARNYYYFRIYPNNSCSSGGDWQLVRRRDDNETTLKSGSCSPTIRRGYAFASRNTIRAAHNANRLLSVYINGTLVGTYQESSSQELTGEATGIYVRASSVDMLAKFDDFKVYKYP